jgi:hypothetical protein
MQARVHQFEATYKMEESTFRDVPACKESFCKVLLSDSTAFATRSLPRSLASSASSGQPGGDRQEREHASVQGFQEFMQRAVIPIAKASALLANIVELGAVTVEELRKADWESLPAWADLAPFEKRRVLQHAPA